MATHVFIFTDHRLCFLVGYAAVFAFVGKHMTPTCVVAISNKTLNWAQTKSFAEIWPRCYYTPQFYRSPGNSSTIDAQSIALGFIILNFICIRIKFLIIDYLVWIKFWGNGGGSTLRNEILRELPPETVLTVLEGCDLSRSFFCAKRGTADPDIAQCDIFH